MVILVLLGTGTVSFFPQVRARCCPYPTFGSPEVHLQSHILPYRTSGNCVRGRGTSDLVMPRRHLCHQIPSILHILCISHNPHKFTVDLPDRSLPCQCRQTRPSLLRCHAGVLSDYSQLSSMAATSESPLPCLVASDVHPRTFRLWTDCESTRENHTP